MVHSQNVNNFRLIFIKTGKTAGIVTGIVLFLLTEKSISFVSS